MAATGVGSQSDVMTLPDKKPWGRGSEGWRRGSEVSGSVQLTGHSQSTLLVSTPVARPEPLLSA